MCEAAELVRPFFVNADKEYLLVCCLDNIGHSVSVEVVAIGIVDSCLVGIGEVFKNAILSNAYAILLYHNHPSGDLKPSRDDILVTDRVMKAGELVGIPLVDHIIVGDADGNGIIDANGTIDANDALLVLKKAAKLIEKFPAEKEA